MGNSRAYPVFRTSDAVEAWTQALRLTALLEEHDDEVILMADMLTVEDTRRMAAVLPDAEFCYVHPRRDPVTHDYTEFNLAITTAEEQFVRAVGKGKGMASIGRGGRWPDDAEAERPGAANYDGVEVVFNGDDVHLSQPADHHTVFVHVDNWGDLSRAEKLAAHLDSTVLGDAQVG